jgi:hypothetical protein
MKKQPQPPDWQGPPPSAIEIAPALSAAERGLAAVTIEPYPRLSFWHADTTDADREAIVAATEATIEQIAAMLARATGATRAQADRAARAAYPHLIGAITTGPQQRPQQRQRSRNSTKGTAKP